MRRPYFYYSCILLASKFLLSSGLFSDHKCESKTQLHAQVSDIDNNKKKNMDYLYKETLYP